MKSDFVNGSAVHLIQTVEELRDLRSKLKESSTVVSVSIPTIEDSFNLEWIQKLLGFVI